MSSLTNPTRSIFPTHFSHDWFSHNIGIWEKFLAPYKGTLCFALEIGCYEGQASLWLLENILTNEDSSICCIDHFRGSEEHKGMDFSGVKDRFLQNTERFRSKILLIDEPCESALFTLKPECYDIVYVDGSHRACHALRDIVISFELLKNDGIMIIDDYAWNAYPNDPMMNPGPAIDAFLSIYAPRIALLHKEYQVIVKKHAI